MNNESLYETVKNKICDWIFEGVYEDGEKIPPERELAEALEVSRVTIRKSLELLEQERLIVREVGRGTRVSFHNGGNPGELDMIVLIAPAKNPFFSKFIARFQSYAQKKGCLVLYVEKPRTEELENCLYRLYKRGLHNVVIWLEELAVDAEKLKRLRAIGMNMVFFDSDKGMPYADCVTVNNELAIQTLYKALLERGRQRIGYVGWDLADVYSVKKREEAYLSLGGNKELCCHLSWTAREKNEQKMLAAFGKWKDTMPDAIICSDRECGKLALSVVKKQGLNIQPASVDEVGKKGTKTVITYEQDLKKTVEQIFSCLFAQCKTDYSWSAHLYQIEGITWK